VDSGPLSVQLCVNGEPRGLIVEPHRSLLDVLREDLQLTGAKKVCDMGNCGACTVLVNGKPMYACLMLAIDWSDADIQTIEGLARDGELDPVQRAVIAADAFQCGFCTPGQIMSLKGLLNETAVPTDEEIVRALSGNLCRCGAYANLLRAGRMVAGRDPDDAQGADAEH
jgi:xanthine dehydrogenase YagT iron-sulfur-binding subunit